MNFEKLVKHIRLFLLLFLVFAFFFGLPVTFLFYFIDPGAIPFSFAIFLGVSCGTLFGLCMASFFVIMEAISSSKSELRPTREILLKGDFDNIFNQINNVLKIINFKIQSLDKENGIIKAIAPGTFLRGGPLYGENIIFILKTSSGGVLVSISSKPRSPLQIVDMGKNLRNVENIINLLEGKNSYEEMKENIDPFKSLTKSKIQILIIVLFIVIPTLVIPNVFLKFFGGEGSEQTLAERKIDIEGKHFSILIPKNHITTGAEKDNELNLQYFSNVNDDTRGILVSYRRLLPSDKTDCASQNMEESFQVTLFNEDTAPICKTQSQISKSHSDLILSYINNSYFYSVIIDINENYFQTTEGQSKVKQVFESFKIIE